MAARRPQHAQLDTPTRSTGKNGASHSGDRAAPRRAAARRPSGVRAAGEARPARSRDRQPQSQTQSQTQPRAQSQGIEPTPSSDAAPLTSATFTELGLPDAMVTALAAQGITTPRPIQAATLRDCLAGRDVLGRGRTGSGKTYAFVLPLLARLAISGSARRPGRPRALILAPTRELVTQIEAVLTPLAQALSLRTLTVFGGVGANPQIRGLRAGVDVVVACPGRLLDHVREGHANLGSVEITVLDEADHMADLGFLPDVRRLMDGTARDGQRLLFSATLDAGVDVLVRRFLTDPVTHSVDPATSPVSAMEHHVLHIRRDDRLPVLVDMAAAPGRTLVFTRTKHGARQLAKRLVAAGVPAVDLHGNLSQNARQRNLEAFSSGSATTLVATDIAARGIHVDDIALVIHADPPIEHKAYLHRSGRTARGDASGTVVTLVTDEMAQEVRDLTRRAGIKPTTTRVGPGDPHLALIAPGERSFVTPAAAAPKRPAAPSGSGGGSRGSGAPARASGGRGRGASGRGSGGRGRGASRTSSSGSAHSLAAHSANGRSGRSRPQRNRAS